MTRGMHVTTMKMKTMAFLSVAVASALLTEVAAAQVGFGVRAGTLGLGGELAIDVGERTTLRGGAGFWSLTASTTIDDINVEVAFPDSWYNVGLDVYLNSAFRIGGGVLFKGNDLMVTGSLDAPVDIGGRTFTPEEVGTLTGTLLNRSRAGYLLLGFGKHSSKGVGLTLDVGAAFTGTPTVQLDAQGGTFSDQAELDARLEQEARNFEEDVKGYFRIWPILSLGLRIGTG